ncbi:MAG: peptidoglycan-binding protein [Pseudomonadota bacterium]
MRALVALILTIVLAAPLPARADAAFERWLDETAWPAAAQAGVDRAAFERLTRGLTPDFTLPGLAAAGGVPARDSQAEFAAPERYFNEASLRALATQGRALAEKHGPLLARLERETGVPGRIVLAIWGRESAYGRAAIPHDALRVLATRGFAGTRRPLFTAEFAKALVIAEETGLSLRASWGGAMGQPQFLPSSYLAHARDGDGDGRADIWGSEADTLASIAGYLADKGWVAGSDWGYEITLPESVPCTRNGPDQAKRIFKWEEDGVVRVSRRPFPVNERRVDGFLVLPAGTQGPAFMATPNFTVLKAYNESDLYALFVGNLADRIAFGATAFQGAWAPTDAMTRGHVARAQERLVRLGYDVGGANGLIGNKTRRAVGLWQESQGLTPTCFPDRALLEALLR